MPSIGGSAVSLFLLVLLGFVFILSSFTENGYIREAFSQVAVNETAANRYQQVSLAINSSELVGNAVIFAVWAVIGLVLFNLVWVLMSSKRSISELARLFVIRHRAQEAFQERAVQMTIRVAALILLIGLLILFVTWLLPYLITAFDTTLLVGPIEYAAAIISVWLVLVACGHLAVVLLRCMLLRYRLLGDYQAVV